MMINEGTFSTAGLNEIAMTQLGPILYGGRIGADVKGLATRLFE